jgi:hypothetical protein
MKYNTELREFLYCESQGCARPRLANWTIFNAARLCRGARMKTKTLAFPLILFNFIRN